MPRKKAVAVVAPKTRKARAVKAAPSPAPSGPDLTRLLDRIADLEKIVIVVASFAPIYREHAPIYRLLNFKGRELSVAHLRKAEALMRERKDFKQPEPELDE